MEVVMFSGNTFRNSVMGQDGVISSGGLLKFVTSRQFLYGIGFGLFVSYTLRRLFRKSDSRRKSDRSVELENDKLYSDYGGEVKLVIVVRNDLKMGKGKIAAQCAHAAVKAFRIADQLCPELLVAWLANGEPKVVVKTDTEADLLALRKAARAEGLVVALIQDAGRTQIAPGSRTVLGVGPGPAEVVDRVTGHLKLC